MSKTVMIAATAMLSVSPIWAIADSYKGCPPGLAKKQNGCLPPGQAKKIYGRGERLSGDYTLIGDPGRYGLNAGEVFYRVGDNVYRVDRDTRRVLELIGAVSAILN